MVTIQVVYIFDVQLEKKVKKSLKKLDQQQQKKDIVLINKAIYLNLIP